MMHPDIRECSLYVTLLLLLSMLCLPGLMSAQTFGQLVVAYYPSWMEASYPHTVIPYQHLTHIAHAFIAPTATGGLEAPSGFLYPQLIQESHAHGVKVLVSVGGWGDYSSRFSPMVADTASRHRFVGELVGFCQTNGYDGADLDWEYPASDADRANLRSLVAELRAAFDGVNPRLLLTMAGPSSGWSGKWFDFEGMSDHFDWIGIMTYDYYGSWTSTSGPNSPLYGDNWVKNTQGWADYSVDYYSVTRGVPKAKLLTGIPFYGWLFNASAMYGASTGASQLTYAAILPRLSQGWVRSWDATGLIPYMTNPAGTQVLSYDDSISVALKCAYVKSKGVAGAIIWALGQDYTGEEHLLLDVVGWGLRGSTAIPVSSAAGLPVASAIEQNFPNPFNPVTGIRYQVSVVSDVRLEVCDVLGREVAVLANERKSPGTYEVRFDGTGLASGVYLYRLRAGETVMTKRMLLLK